MLPLIQAAWVFSTRNVEPDSAEPFNPESFDPELMTEGLVAG